MARGAPDGVLMVEVAVTIDNVATVPPSITTTNYYTYEAEKQAAIQEAMTTVERAAGATGRYSGTDQVYQELCTWTVAAGKTGELKEILITSSNYAKTSLQVTIGDVIFTTDWLTQAAMPLIFEDMRLEAGTEVLLEVKSTDGTSITVDGVITAKEIG